MKRDLAIRALNMAIALRKPPIGCIHHTDRGSQYAPTTTKKSFANMAFRSQCLEKAIAGITP